MHRGINEGQAQPADTAEQQHTGGGDAAVAAAGIAAAAAAAAGHQHEHHQQQGQEHEQMPALADYYSCLRCERDLPVTDFLVVGGSGSDAAAAAAAALPMVSPHCRDCQQQQQQLMYGTVAAAAGGPCKACIRCRQQRPLADFPLLKGKKEQHGMLCRWVDR